MPSSKCTTVRSGWTNNRVAVMRSRRTRIMRLARHLLGLLIATTVLLGPIVAPPAEAQTPKRGGTPRGAYGHEILGMDFYPPPGYEMVWVATNVGCGLVSMTPDGKFIPDAAESWQVSSDGLLYTVKLRQNGLFTYGNKDDARAV